ncbi:MAG: universal stress protein [Proteobacteria bacterium]|nr:universal stress protein [Pseudomonadota bacterium]
MMMLETILATVDPSDQKYAVLFHAAEMTRRFGSKLHLVSVYDLSQLSSVRISEPVPDIIETMEAETKQLLEKAQQQLDEWGIASQTHFLEGSVIDQIALLAEQINADLIVMGHHHASRLKRLLKNSAAKGLIDKSPCSIMIVRESEQDPEQ